jgi:ferredoxin--NADP+ reductase
VDYDELILRLRAYQEEERKCHRDYCTIRDAV